MRNLDKLAIDYKNAHKPLRIIPWKDKQTSAIGWIVVDSLVNGIAGGGCSCMQMLRYKKYWI